MTSSLTPSTIPSMTPLVMPSMIPPVIPSVSSPDSVQTLTIRHMCVRVPNRGLILQDVSFDMMQGQLLSLMGPNGGGKTTLCQALTGHHKEGHVTGSLSVTLASGLSRPLQPGDWCYLPQRFAGDRFFPLRAIDFLQLSFPTVAAAHLDTCIQRLKLSPYLYRHLHELSEGQFQRLLLARMGLHTQPIMILDEPFAGLDEPMIAEALALFKEWAEHGRMVIVAHHNRQRALQHFPTTLIVAQRTYRWGPSHEVLDPCVWTELHETVSRVECC